ncbi:MAG TPA: hypothetical protein VH598_07830, partial [Verrucomicrobiae bacterium]|nr:hypothetical protein [Verrucomicrobiae bacterium]
LPQGQLTLAIVPNGRPGKDQGPGLLLLLDTKDKSSQLKTNLADLKKKWVDSGKTIRAEKIRDLEFSVVVLSKKDDSLKKSTAVQPPGTPELPEEPDTKTPENKTEIYIGQADSLLIAGNSPKTIEKVLAALSGGAIKTLGEVPAFDSNQGPMFRNAAAYGWANARAWVEMFSHQSDGVKEIDPESNPFSFKPDKLIAALGLNGLKAVAVNFLSSGEGSEMNFFLGVPEANRQGLFKLLAGEAKEYSAPSFVPADAVKFQRWRLDGQKAWATLQKIVGDFSPQALNGINFFLSTAESAAKEKDPGFDLKKNVFGNLGDDMITYQKSPRGSSPADLNSPPSLFLIGSPNPEQLAGALKSLPLGMFLQGGGAITEREFLGHKILSMSLPAPPRAGGAPSTPGTLSLAASGGYLAVTSDTGMLEEYLRSGQGQGKSLRESPGLGEAMQKVAGSGTSLFGYSNDGEGMRVTFESFKKNANGPGLLAALGPLTFPLGLDESKLKDALSGLDFSLLPAYDQVAKYFYFSVYAGNASAEGLNLKLYAPTPPQLKK